MSLDRPEWLPPLAPPRPPAGAVPERLVRRVTRLVLDAQAPAGDERVVRSLQAVIRAVFLEESGSTSPAVRARIMRDVDDAIDYVLWWAWVDDPPEPPVLGELHVTPPAPPDWSRAPRLDGADGEPDPDPTGG